MASRKNLAAEGAKVLQRSQLAARLAEIAAVRPPTEETT
jgi:hypothetical protein